MTDETDRQAVAAIMRTINNAWLRGRIGDVTLLIDPHIVMTAPAREQPVTGRDPFLAGFEDFTRAAHIHDFRSHTEKADVVGSTALVRFSYDLTYERHGQRHHASGTDLWTFQRRHDAWIATRRTMLDVTEQPA